LEKMKERVLVRTGALRDALKIVERKNEITIEVGGDPATYALVVDSGSRPHVIFPKIKSVLSWEN